MTPAEETEKAAQEVETSLERAEPLPAVEPSRVSSHDDGEHSPVFDALVTRDGEVGGLVAYAIYKQNKRAWLSDLIKSTGRPPTNAEARAYVIGESTERRLMTYRHLAAATLSGQGSETLSHSSSLAGLSKLAWGLLLVASLAILLLALRFAGGLDFLK
jgi:hypothetical protein